MVQLEKQIGRLSVIVGMGNRGNGMREMRGRGERMQGIAVRMRGIWVGMQGIAVRIRGIWVGMWGRITLHIFFNKKPAYKKL